MARLRTSLIIGVLLVVIAACSNHPFSPNSKTLLDPPKGNVDADVMALCLSGELTAPDDLYDQLDRDLQFLRSTYGGTVPKINQISFRPPWVVSCLLIAFTDASAVLVSQGTYHAWDQLNERYHLKNIDAQSIATSKMAVLNFDGRLHPRRLAELYKGLPGVLYAEPNGVIGDGPNIYPRKTELGISYLLRDAWGDCPAGCMHAELWYFSRRLVLTPPALIGQWLSVPGAGPVPLWFAEARKNVLLWRTF